MSRAFHEIAPADRPAVKTILDAAGGRDNVYYLGPFAKRISFASQQTRALNLVWAMKCAKVVVPNDEVAVVGGGLSGITAAASLLDLGCRVTLFETTDDVVGRQRHTKHRFVHPNINLWPGSALCATTEFPFFDWYAGVCADALQMILEDWKDYYQNHPNLRVPPKIGVQKPIPAGERVTFRTIEGDDAGRYRAAIVATGFSEEREIDGLPFISYWKDDKLEELRDNSKFGEWFLVTGCGDGGIIDALRLSYRTAHFARGALLARVAERLGPTSAGASLADRPSDIIFDGEQEAARQDSDATAEYILFQNYRKAVEKLPDDIRKLLNDALHPRTGIVMLVGRESYAYSRSAAPINKLLLAFAELAGKIEYKQGTREDNFKRATFKIDGAVEELTGMVTSVVRHGAPLAIEKSNFIGPRILKQLEGLQRQTWDTFDAPLWRGHGRLSAHPSYDPTDTTFIARRRKRIEGYLRENFPGCGISFMRRGLRVRNAASGLPSQVFGIALTEGGKKRIRDA